MKRYSLAGKIMFVITMTAILLGIVIITAGAVMIYNAKEDSIRSEVQTAAHTFLNIYNKNYSGELSYDGETIRAGDEAVSIENLIDIISVISCEDDVDFSLFYKDTRIFTSVTNNDGSYAVGTNASEEVSQMVIGNGKEYLYPRVLVNGRYYLGCYIPIKTDDGKVQGMVFAGKPLSSADSTALSAVSKFVFLTVFTLIIVLIICFIGLRPFGRSVTDLNQFLATLANGDFSAQLSEKTIKRNDEIGELAVNMIKVRKNLKDMVELDPLTSLLNRRSCKVRLEQMAESTGYYAVVMGDIDFFKQINDTYGHAAGDYVLKEISAIIEACAKGNGGFASRWGGEEFLMALPDTVITKAEQLINNLLYEIRNRTFSFDNKDFPVTMTFGISVSTDSDSYEAVINRADKLLYKGKADGRNKVVV